jgi:hypothetical protein
MPATVAASEPQFEIRLVNNRWAISRPQSPIHTSAARRAFCELYDLKATTLSPFKAQRDGHDQCEIIVPIREAEPAEFRQFSTLMKFANRNLDAVIRQKTLDTADRNSSARAAHVAHRYLAKLVDFYKLV